MEIDSGSSLKGYLAVIEIHTSHVHISSWILTLTVVIASTGSHRAKGTYLMEMTLYYTGELMVGG